MKGHNKKAKKIFLVFIAISLVIGGISVAYSLNFGLENILTNAEYKISDETAASIPNTLEGQYEASGICTKVVDGDTIWVSGVGKVRFVGVNTPEKTEDGYREAKDFVNKLCLGKPVGLDIDDAKHYDKYNRTLAVVYLENGTNLNQLLLQEGYAEIMYIPPSEFNPYTWQ